MKKYILLTVLAVIIIVGVPMPFKPSIWSYIHRKQLDRNLATYSAPLYIPPQSGASGVSFDTYLGWKDSYLVRGFSNNRMHSGGYGYYQFAKDGKYSAVNEGPSQSDLRPYMAAMAMNCETHNSGIQICQVGSPKQYIAKLDVGEAILLSDLTRYEFNKKKLDANEEFPEDYLPPSEDAIQKTAAVLTSTRPVPIAEAKKYFKPEF